MKIIDEPLRHIEPAPGMRLTNGDVIAEGNVYLAINDSADNWYEITDEEAERIQTERDETNELLSVGS